MRVIKKVLEVLQKDGVIDCNQYQGKDFERLLSKVVDEKAIETAVKANTEYWTVTNFDVGRELLVIPTNRQQFIKAIIDSQ